MIERPSLSPLSLLLTILVASLLGAASALVGRAPLPTPAPRVDAEIHAPRATTEREPLELLLRVSNHGPGDALAPLDGVLSLGVTDLSGGASGAPPLAAWATADVTATAQGPLVLPANASVEARVSVAGLPLDHAGTYRVSGELVGPAGILPVGPIDVVIVPAPVRAENEDDCGGSPDAC